VSTIVVELYEALRQAGVDEQLARDAAHAVLGSDMQNELATKADVALLRADLADFRAATKSDLADSRTGIRAELAEFRTDMRSEFAEFKTDMRAEFIEFRSDMRTEFADFRSEARAEFASKADVANTRVELIKWNVGAMAVLTAIFAAIARLG
jgi:hypothetical protein